MASKYESRRAKIKLGRIIKEVPEIVKPAMQDTVNRMHGEMRRRVPTKTGRLRDMITAFVSKDGRRGEVGFRGKKGRQKAFYARFIEFGTKGHRVTATKKQVLSDGSQTYGTAAYIPPLPARPFIGPTWDDAKPYAINKMGEAMRKAVDKVAKG